MALVCDIESSTAAPPEAETPLPEATEPASLHTELPVEEEAVPDDVDNPDLEDGEIEDDEGEEEPPPPTEAEKPKEAEAPAAGGKEKREKSSERTPRHDKDKRRHDDKKTRHMTEAEKSILHLRRRERMQREKWEKYRRDQTVETQVDDFAINLEKAIASVLKKDRHSDEEKEDDVKRGRKRKHRDRDKQKSNKQRKIDSPSKITEEDFDNSSPNEKKESDSPQRSEESNESDSSERSKSDDRRRKDNKKNKNKNRDRKRRSRERRNEQQQQQQQQPKDSQGVCVFFLQGKCQKNDCPYSHEAAPPMKLELCKFYLKDCCAKGGKCSYMHSEFPCKFYHTGLVCLQKDDCKFAHGGPLDEHRRQILFKHIETAPREILGGFPRMSREECLNKINTTQQSLCVQYGAPEPEKDITNIFDITVPIPMEANSEVKPLKQDKPGRQRPSRWQDPVPAETTSFIPPFAVFPPTQDCDMRISSNGDIDMRTLHPPLSQTQQPIEEQHVTEPEQNFTQDIDIRNPNMMQFDTKDVDIRQAPILLPNKDVDIRQIPGEVIAPPVDLPKTQRDLFMRIQSQQKTNVPETLPESLEIDNINWYSDDDDEDDNRLMIKMDNEEEKKEEQESHIMSPPQIKPQDVVEKLGDLSKIDISAEVTKLLTSMSQQKTEIPKVINRDPRQQKNVDESAKVSIYEQGSITSESGPRSPDDVIEGDLRGRPDVDLRNLSLPFKGMLNYTPAKEIDASVNSHPPMLWKVEIVDIPRPDYTGLKLNIQDAEKTGDPRLRKIFRLSTEEKDSPASPKASPKASATRIDPRLKKIEEQKPPPQSDATTMSYNQQLSILHTSPFFQSLTSNQKVLLNQELANRNEQNGINDPVLGGMLSSLNLVPNTNIANPNMGAALNILANVNNLNAPPMMGGQPPQMRQNQPPMMGLLGAAPGIPNDYPPMNFNYNNQGNFQDNFGGFDEYYQGPPPNQQQDNFRDNRGFNNRDRRRGRNHFNRNNGNRNFRNRNHRNNRGHTPP